MSLPKWTLEIPHATQLQVPLDFQWADTGGARDVSGNTANLVIYGASPATIALTQDTNIISRKILSTTEATFPVRTTLAAELQLLLNGVTVDRLIGTIFVVAATP